MSNAENIKDTISVQERPALVKKIGNTTFIVNVHFSENAKETLQQKIERMLADEVRYGTAI